MALVIPNIEGHDVLGYLSTYFEDDKRFSTVYNTGIVLPAKYVENTETKWIDNDVPLVLVDRSDFLATAQKTNNFYDDRRGIKEGHYYYDLIPLEQPYAELIRSKYSVEPSTELFRVFKYGADASSDVINAVKNVPIYEDTYFALANNPQTVHLTQPTFDRFTNNVLHHPPLHAQMNVGKSVPIYNINGVEQAYAFGVVVVADIKKTTVQIEPPRIRPDERMAVAGADIIVPPHVIEIKYHERIQSILATLSNETVESLNRIIAELKLVIRDIASDSNLNDESSTRLRHMVLGMITNFESRLLSIATVSNEDFRGGESTDVTETTTTKEPTVDSEVVTATLASELNKILMPDIDSDVYTYKKLRLDQDIVETERPLFTRGMWSGNVDSLFSFFTSSAQSSTSSKYYYNVYSSDVNASCGSFKQFDVFYAHRLGSGSLHYHSKTHLSPSKTMYSQLQMMCFGNTTQSFSFKNGITSDSIYAMSIPRELMKDKVDAGNWKLTLSNIANPATVFHLIDDSGDVGEYYSVNNKTLPSYNIMSGTLGGGVYSDTDNSWGIVYPSLGLFIFNGNVLDASCSFATVSSSNTNGNNHIKLFSSISASASPYGSRTVSHSFDARSVEREILQTYFIRAKSSEYNMSTNPTWVSGSNGDFLYTEYKVNPTSYITTVGLYNDNYELVAVAKVPYALRKSTLDDYTFRVRVKIQ